MKFYERPSESRWVDECVCASRTNPWVTCCVLEVEPELADRLSLHEIPTDVAQFRTTYTNSLTNKLTDHFNPFEAFVALCRQDISWILAYISRSLKWLVDIMTNKREGCVHLETIHSSHQQRSWELLSILFMHFVQLCYSNSSDQFRAVLLQ
jgi:hypothetical protein